MNVCTIDGCDRQVRARGWCPLHWQRWYRTGDPTKLLGRGRPRRDAWQHGSRRGYQQGCRCFDCRIAENRYQRAWEHDGHRQRIPAGQVIAHLEQLLASGWTKAEIRRAANLGNSTIHHIMSGRSNGVNSRTATAIFDLEPFQKTVRLPAGPFIQAIDDRLRGQPLSALIHDNADRRCYYRARANGNISELIADRILVRWLGRTIDEVY